jgi:hypothetical protein
VYGWGGLVVALVIGGACSRSSPAPAEAGTAVDAADARSEGDERAIDVLEGRSDVAVTTPDAHDAPAPDGPGDSRDAVAPEGPADATAEAAVWHDPFGGATGCPAGGFPTGAPSCGLTMPVSGGASTVAGDYCRNSASTSRLWYATNGINLDVYIDLGQPIVRGMIASDIPAVVSFEDARIGGSFTTWATPGGACTVTLTSNVCWIYLNATYYLVSGTGKCSAPAAAQPAKAGAPIVIGDFSFSYTIFP